MDRDLFSSNIVCAKTLKVFWIGTQEGPNQFLYVLPDWALLSKEVVKYKMNRRPVGLSDKNTCAGHSLKLRDNDVTFILWSRLSGPQICRRHSCAGLKSFRIRQDYLTSNGLNIGNDHPLIVELICCLHARRKYWPHIPTEEEKKFDLPAFWGPVGVLSAALFYNVHIVFVTSNLVFPSIIKDIYNKIDHKAASKLPTLKCVYWMQQ